MLNQKSNKVLCTCLKCCQNDTEGVGLLIPKSTRTRHRKQEKIPIESNLTLSSATSSLSISDIRSSSESEPSTLMDSNENIDFLYSNTSEANIIPADTSVNMYVL